MTKKIAVLSDRIYASYNEDFVLNLRKELNYVFPGPNPKNDQPIRYYDVIKIKDILSIPIGRIDLIPDDYEIIDKRIEIPKDYGNFKYELRPNQQDLCNIIADSCVVKAHTGYGKSVLGIYLAKKFKQKTLIITHTTLLRDQWINEIRKIADRKAGIIGSGKFDIEPNIVVGNIQTLRNRITEIRKQFGLIIVDECHRQPAKTFSYTVNRLNSRYKIGLSATIGRKDERTPLIFDYLGNKLYTTKDVHKVIPEIFLVDTNIDFSASFNIPWADRVTNLTRDPEYIVKVVSLVKAQQERGYKILVLADRTEFIEKCQSLTDRSLCIQGSTKERETLLNRISGDIDCIYGTTAIFKEGFNQPRLDCLIIATPINNKYLLEQIVGRVLRPHKEKKKPQIFDFILKGNTGYNQLNTRIAFYKSQNYQIWKIS